MVKNVFRLHEDSEFETKYTTLVTLEKEKIAALFKKRGLLPNSYQMRNVLRMEEAVSHDAAVIAVGEPCSGKSLCIDVFLEMQGRQLRQRDMRLRTLKLNPSILNISNTNDYSSVEIGDLLLEDNLEYLLRRITLANSPKLQHYLLFEGPIERNFWDLLANLFIQRSSTSKSELSTSFDDKIVKESRNTQFGINITNFRGKGYHFQKNITPIVETTDLCELTPSSLTYFTIINFDQVVNAREMIEILSLKFFNSYARKLNIPSYESVSVPIKDLFATLFVQVESNLLSKSDRPKLRALLFSFFHIFESLIKDMQFGSSEGPVQDQQSTVQVINTTGDHEQDSLTITRKEEQSKDPPRRPSKQGPRTSTLRSTSQPRRPSAQASIVSSRGRKQSEAGAIKRQSTLMMVSTLSQNIETYATLAFIWAIGALLSSKERQEFIILLEKYLQTRFEENLILKQKLEDVSLDKLFNYHYNIEKAKLTQYWDEPELYSRYLSINQLSCFATNRQSLFVPTLQNIELAYYWTLASRCNADLALYGGVYSGKSSALWFLQKWVNETSYSKAVAPLPLSNPRKKDISQFYKKILGSFDEKKPGSYTLKENRLPLIVIDDLNISKAGNKRELDTAEFIRFWKRNRGIYSITSNRFYSTGPAIFAVSVSVANQSDMDAFMQSRSCFEYIKYNQQSFDEQRSVQSVFKGLLSYGENPKLIIKHREKVFKFITDLVEKQLLRTPHRPFDVVAYQYTHTLKNVLNFLDNTDFVK